MKRVTKKNGKIFISVFSENSLEYRLQAYEKAGMKILNIYKDGTVLSNAGLKLEQFDKKKLKGLFTSQKLKFKILYLTPISYMCILKPA